jgi:hypothetical protein
MMIYCWHHTFRFLPERRDGSHPHPVEPLAARLTVTATF